MLQGAVAQLGERLVCNQEATGSIPVSSTKICRRGILMWRLVPGIIVGVLMLVAVFYGRATTPGSATRELIEFFRKRNFRK